MNKRKPLMVVVLIPLIVGISGLVRLMSQPRFASIRTVDVVQLTGSGVCFGVAMVAFFMLLRSKRDA